MVRLSPRRYSSSRLSNHKMSSSQETDSLIARGNNTADEAAKQAATAMCMGPLLVAEDCEPLTTLSSLIEAQRSAGIYEHSVRLKCGALKCAVDGPQKDLWRGPHGHFVLPTALLTIAILSAHGQDHCARGEVLRRLRAVWWSPLLAATLDKTLNECIVCAQHNV